MDGPARTRAGQGIDERRNCALGIGVESAQLPNLCYIINAFVKEMKECMGLQIGQLETQQRMRA